MYQIYVEILSQITLYVNFIRENKEHIKEIVVRNKLDDVSGRVYCKIYVDIKVRENAAIDENALEFEAYRYMESCYFKNYFSFYLGKQPSINDNDEQLYNKEEETHFNYIWHLLAWHLKNDEIPVKAEPFQNQKMLQYKRRREHEEFEKKWKAITEVTENLPLELGQLVAVKNYSSLRIGEAVKLVLPGRKQSFQMDLAELKKDLCPGKVIISHVQPREVYAIVDKDKLPVEMTKAELISIIEKGNDSDFILWRRPSELWD